MFCIRPLLNKMSVKIKNVSLACWRASVTKFDDRYKNTDGSLFAG